MSFVLKKDRGQKTEDKGWNHNPLSFVLCLLSSNKCEREDNEKESLFGLHGGDGNRRRHGVVRDGRGGPHRFRRHHVRRDGRHAHRQRADVREDELLRLRGEHPEQRLVRHHRHREGRPRRPQREGGVRLHRQLDDQRRRGAVHREPEPRQHVGHGRVEGRRHRQVRRGDQAGGRSLLRAEQQAHLCRGRGRRHGLQERNRRKSRHGNGQERNRGLVDPADGRHGFLGGGRLHRRHRQQRVRSGRPYLQRLWQGLVVVLFPRGNDGHEQQCVGGRRGQDSEIHQHEDRLDRTHHVAWRRQERDRRHGKRANLRRGQSRR